MAQAVLLLYAYRISVRLYICINLLQTYIIIYLLTYLA